MNSIIKFLIFLIIISVEELLFCRFTGTYYCKKNKGNCKKCKCWNCYRMQYLDNEGNLKE